eukprot:NODE_126_length_18761_cov_0.476262.p3 type:complete len:406 gc:universal NODE_126_length_18761_cov_0.476262:17008-18225(+)
MGNKLVVLGTGWSSYSLVRNLRKAATVISPRNHFVFTPLLASTTVGTLEFRTITEPIRRLPHVDYYEGSCTKIDLDQKQLTYRDWFDNDHIVPYDQLVLGFGCVPNTFNIAGANKYSLFLREIHHARKIRKRIIECLEFASHNDISLKEKQELLHFCIVGAGATGIEFAGELYDFILSDIIRSYPKVVPFVKITIFDVSDRILGTFDKSLSQYAYNKFMRDGIELRLSTKIIKVTKSNLELLNGELVPYGLLVWSTGLSEHPLTKSLNVDKYNSRLSVDNYCRVLKDSKSIPGVYAIGDCASSVPSSLPQTAQVAAQEGIYLASQLNNLAPRPFEYRHLFTMAYIGSWKSIIDKPGVGRLHGTIAWLIWRSAYFTQTVSWKNKILIPVYWFTSWIFGREISRIKE